MPPCSFFIFVLDKALSRVLLNSAGIFVDNPAASIASFSPSPKHAAKDVSSSTVKEKWVCLYHWPLSKSGLNKRSPMYVAAAALLFSYVFIPTLIIRLWDWNVPERIVGRLIEFAGYSPWRTQWLCCSWRLFRHFLFADGSGQPVHVHLRLTSINWVWKSNMVHQPCLENNSFQVYIPLNQGCVVETRSTLEIHNNPCCLF